MDSLASLLLRLPTLGVRQFLSSSYLNIKRQPLISLVTSQHYSCQSQAGSSEGRKWRRTRRQPARPHGSSPAPPPAARTRDSTSPSLMKWCRLDQGPRSPPRESETQTGTNYSKCVLRMKAEWLRLRCQSVFESNSDVASLTHFFL